MKLHLVDATFELFRAYFSRPAQSAPDGRPVNAVRGLLESMLSLLREPDVTHVAAATDHVIESWRNDVYPAYKSSAGMPVDLLAESALLFSSGMGATATILMAHVKAGDEVICSAAIYGGTLHLLNDLLSRFGVEPRFVSLEELAAPERVLRDRMRGITYDEAGVIAKFGVRPGSIPDYLALVGDSADGYPGLPGWGSKSAATVLRRFEHLEAIPESALDWEVPLRNATQLAATLRQQRADAMLYRRLATLGNDAQISDDLASLEWDGVPREAFLALCDELGFERIKERVHRWA